MGSLEDDAEGHWFRPGLVPAALSALATLAGIALAMWLLLR